MDYQDIEYQVEDPVAVITLNRPDRLNAMTVRMLAEIRHASAAAEADPRVLGIILTGAGRGFCAGMDLSALDEISASGEVSREAPPALAADDPRGQRQDPRYSRLDPAQIPLTECLKDTVARVLPCWNERLAPAIRSGQRVLIAAHGNSMRALVKYLDGISDGDIVGINIPNGIPLVYELDEALKPIRHYYLGDPEAAARAAAAVASQGKA